MANERRTFSWVYAAGAVLLILIQCLAITLAIQEHNNRVLSDDITNGILA